MKDKNWKNFVKIIKNFRKNNFTAKLAAKIINVSEFSIYQKMVGAHKIYDFEIIALKIGYYQYLKKKLSKLENGLKDDKII